MEKKILNELQDSSITNAKLSFLVFCEQTTIYVQVIVIAL